MKIKPMMMSAAAFCVAIGMTVLASGCFNPMDNLVQEREGNQEHGEGHGSRERGEHRADDGGKGEGEEDSTPLERNATYDAVRNGAHLVLKYDVQAQAFNGVVKNVSKKNLERVRVEVHFSKRFEVGPTKPGDLKPGESRSITLTPETNDFSSWSTHAEVGNEEHGDREGHAERREGRGEHGGRGRGEHRRREGRGEHAGREGQQRRERHGSRERGEHAADVGGEGEGEEDGTQLKRNEIYDVVKNGAHLILKYDEKARAFKGVVKNVSRKTLKRVRVEVHFTKRYEVGPTKPVNLKPGESQKVTLTPETKDFSSWSTHAEVGNEEHGGREGHAEGREGRGEHGGRGRGERGGREHGDQGGE